MCALSTRAGQPDPRRLNFDARQCLTLTASSRREKLFVRRPGNTGATLVAPVILFLCSLVRSKLEREAGCGLLFHPESQYHFQMTSQPGRAAEHGRAPPRSYRILTGYSPDTHRILTVDNI